MRKKEKWIYGVQFIIILAMVFTFYFGQIIRREFTIISDYWEMILYSQVTDVSVPFMEKENGSTASFEIIDRDKLKPSFDHNQALTQIETVVSVLLFIELVIFVLLEFHRFRGKKEIRLISWVNGEDKQQIVKRELVAKLLIIVSACLVFAIFVIFIPKIADVLMTDNVNIYYEELIEIEWIGYRRDMLMQSHGMPLYQSRVMRMLLFEYKSLDAFT